MIGLLGLLFFGSFPVFTYTDKSDLVNAAEVFQVPDGGDLQTMVEGLIREERGNYQRSAKVVGGDVDSAVRIVRLANTEEEVLYVYPFTRPANEKTWVCRLRSAAGSVGGYGQALRWCLSFVGGASIRPLVKQDQTLGEQVKSID